MSNLQSDVQKDVLRIGDYKTGIVEVTVCRNCDCIVEAEGSCSYGCMYDFDHERHRESFKVQVWRRTDVLIEDREVAG